MTLILDLVSARIFAPIQTSHGLETAVIYDPAQTNRPVTIASTPSRFSKPQRFSITSAPAPSSSNDYEAMLSAWAATAASTNENFPRPGVTYGSGEVPGCNNGYDACVSAGVLSPSQCRQEFDICLPSVGNEAALPTAADKPGQAPESVGAAHEISTYFQGFYVGLTTYSDCFKTHTVAYQNSITTTLILKCVSDPGDQNPLWVSGIDPATGGPPGHHVPHPESTVATSGSNIVELLGGAGRGGNPLPRPESSMLGNNVGSVLDGPGEQKGGLGGEPTAFPAEGPAPIETQGEPGPITAVPAASPTPAPVQTNHFVPAPSGVFSPNPARAGQSSSSGEETSVPPTEPLQPVPSPVLVQPPPIITIGSKTFTADSSSHFIIGSQTLAPGAAVTHSGTLISLAPGGSQVVVGASTQTVQTASLAPVITLGTSLITANSQSQFLVGSQTLIPGGPAITQGGTVVSLAPSASAIVIGGQTEGLTHPAFISRPSITVGGQIITANDQSQYQIGGQTLKPGAAPITENGHTYSLAADGSAIISDSRTQNIAQPAPTPLPVITIGSAKITGNAASQYMVGGQTLAPGTGPITVSGQVISLASAGKLVVFGPSTQAINTPPMVLSTRPPNLTIGGLIVTANAASNYVYAGQTIHPGGSAIVVGGTKISVAPSATELIIGSSTEALRPPSILVTTAPPLVTFGSQILRADASSDYIIGGQTLTPGHAITISGTILSLAPGASEVVIGSSTEYLTPQIVSISTGPPIITIESTTLSANANGQYVISGQTIRPGAHAITIEGQLVSLDSNDSYLVIGTSTERLYPVTKTRGTIFSSRLRSSFDASSSTATAKPTDPLAAATVGSAPAATSSKSGVSKSEASLISHLIPILCMVLPGVLVV